MGVQEEEEHWWVLSSLARRPSLRSAHVQTCAGGCALVHSQAGERGSVGRSRTFSDRERHGHHPIGSRNSVETADEVREIVQYTEVMLHYHHIPM